RGGAWTPKGETPIVKVENTRAIFHSILLTISVCMVVNVSVRKDSAVKAKGTTANHCLRFLKETLDIMDKFECMYDSYLVMDNTLIHKRANIQEMVEKRCYKCIYLPPYSPELNP
ncbi:hypothetical protein BCV72DRAFT_212366, partial [Rhizopus microsporus var. microsporus]